MNNKGSYRPIDNGSKPPQTVKNQKTSVQPPQLNANLPHHTEMDYITAIVELKMELQLYRDAAMYDPLMSGELRFKGWNRSALDRARIVTEQRINKENL